MEALELALLLLAAVLLSSVIDQIVPKISSPLIQIGLGLVIAVFAAGQVDIMLDPDLFLVLFIAPLLYDEARKANKAELWKNRSSVISLAVGLVFVSTLIVGFSVNWLIPSIPLAAAFALGAALGPTDAVAVASLPKEINIGTRQRNILKGESLINDASGIVAFQFAIAAVVTGTFSLADASVDFLVSFFGGIIVGVVLGWLGNFVTTQVRTLGLENTTFHVLFDVFMPFIVYLAAEPLHASGIIAVVAAGLVISVSGQAIGPSISRMNIVSTSVWRVLSFALNGVVFVLLGTQLPKAMRHTWDDVSIGNAELVAYVLAITFALELARFLWLLGVEYAHNRSLPDRPRFGKEQARSALIMALGGPKGTITLAIAFTIPVIMTTGAYFPQRDLIIFLASGVIVCTLLLSNFAVPLFAPKSEAKKAADAGPACESETEACPDETETEVTIEILRNVIEGLAARQTPENRRATQSVIHSYNDRIARIKEHNNIDDEPNTELRLTTLNWEKDYVIDLIGEEGVHPLVGYRYLSRLAHIENLLKHHSGRWAFRNAFMRVRAFLRTSIHNLVRQMPGMSLTERTTAMRELQIKSIGNVVDRLRSEMGALDAPTEDVSALLLEYQRTLASLRQTLPTITTLARSADKTVDIERLGLGLELEAIQNMYDDGRLSRAAAKRLRDNVALMQVDLEDNV